MERNTLGELIERNAGMYSSSPAIISGDTRIDYYRLNADAHKIARSLLACGIGKGDRIALLMDNRPQWPAVALASAKIGAVLTPINIRYRLHELRYILEHASPSVLIMIDRFVDADYTAMMNDLCPELSRSAGDTLVLKDFPSLRRIFCLSDKVYPGMTSFDQFVELGKEVNDRQVASITAEVRPDDPVYILYTSGTTSFPKGVVLTHANICTNGRNIAARLEAVDKDRFWIPIPLFFSFGCANAMMTIFSAGASMVFQHSLDPGDGLKIIEKERCSVIYAMPTIYLPMLDHPDLKKFDLTSVRTGCVIGSPENLKAIMEKMGVSQINNGYGMTETSAICSMTSSQDSEEVRMNTVGKPFSGCRIIIKDPATSEIVEKGKEGEICVKGYNVTNGYFNDPQRTSESFDQDGFLKTGDIGVIRDDDCLQFKGRYKDMLKTSGINVSTLEVECFIETHSEVIEAHVVGIPDQIKQEVGCAFIRKKAGSSCNEDDIIQFCKGNIASYKIPKFIYFMDEFPLTGSGKVKKFELRDNIMKQMGMDKD